MELADQALEGAPGDPVSVLRELDAALTQVAREN